MNTFRDEDGVLHNGDDEEDRAIKQGEVVKFDGTQTLTPQQANQYVITEYLGGQEATALAAFLPERLDWDKKSGLWMAESFGTGLTGFKAKLVGATTAWAIWTDKLGKPEALFYGAKPDDGRQYQMGWRLIFDYEDALFVWDAFGLTVKAAQSIARRAQKRGNWFELDGYKVVNTEFGEFRTPKLTSISEGEK